MVKKNNMKLLDLIQENNESVIKEGALQTIFKTVSDAKTLRSVNLPLFKTFNDVLAFGKAEGKPIEGFTSANKTNRTAIENVDDLIYSVKAGGMEAESIAQFYKGMLKSASSPREIITEIVPGVIESQSFIKEFGKMTPNAMAKELKNRKYSQAAIEEILLQTKKNPKWKTSRSVGTSQRKALKTKNGATKNLNTKTNGSGVPPTQNKTLIQKSQELINGIKSGWNWKKVLTWGVPFSLTGAAIWWWLFNNDEVVPDDIPENEPVDGDWAPCIQELLTSKEGAIAKTSNGQLSVIVKPTDFPGGLQFYNNGRVMDVVGKKMGTWKCKGTKAVIAETQKISLIGLLNEQGGEVDVKTMTDYVNVAINDLDGFVDTGNLTSLLDTLKKLNGKTFQGKNAISGFLSLYKDLESGDDFIADVNSVGVATLDAVAVLAKREIIALAKSGGSATTPKSNTGGKKGLGSIDIIWDGQKNTGDKSTGGGTKKSKYHDCSGKDTFEFGCKAPKIKEIQICLGMEQRYQTGNFGPLTKKALEDMSYDTSQGITVEMYNRIKSTCSGDSNKPRLDGSIEPLKTNLTPKSAPVNADNLKLPNLQPVGQGNRGESIYKGLKNNYGDGTNPEMPYIFSSGGRIKYKGDDLGDDVLGQLDQYIGTLGYQRIKEKDKDYGVKYVWAKQ